jgi:hypothetical protein
MNRPAPPEAGKDKDRGWQVIERGRRLHADGKRFLDSLLDQVRRDGGIVRSIFAVYPGGGVFLAGRGPSPAEPDTSRVPRGGGRGTDVRGRLGMKEERP